MPIRIAICDDEQEDIRRLSDALLVFDPSFEISTYTRGNILIDELEDSAFSADILFLDIYMPGIDGIKTAREIRGRHQDVKIIYLSSSKEHYPQAYEVYAFNYIVKPFSRERLYDVLAHAVEEIQSGNGRKIRVQYKTNVYSVDCRDIQYIESRNKLLFFHLADGKTLQCYGRLDTIMKELPERSFIRCHQSFFVNVRHIAEMGENYFRVGPAVIGISKKYLKSAKDAYLTGLFSLMGEEAAP